MKLKNLFKRTTKTPEERTQLKKDRLLLATSGILLAAGFSPVPLPVTLFFALIPYFIVLEKRESLLAINRATYFMAFVFSLFSVYWVGAYTEAKDYFLMIGGFLVLFLNPIFFLLPSTLYYYAAKLFRKNTALWFLPFFWVSYEFFYTLTDWSFPWLNLHNGLSTFTVFIQIADTIGPYGLTFLLILINILLFKSYIAHIANVEKKRNFFASLALLLFIIPLVTGIIKLNSRSFTGKEFSAVVVQPNLDPYEKWSGGNLNDILKIYTTLSHKAVTSETDLIVWPETALPVYLMLGPYPEARDSLTAFLSGTQIPLLTGMPDIRHYAKGDSMPPDVKYNKIANFYYATYNAIYLYHPNDPDIQKYGKMKLVPFGERVPFVDQIPLLGEFFRWGVGLGGWNVGRDTTVFQVRMKDGGVAKIGAVICYESIYPELIASMCEKGAQALVVVTNDSWYGNTSGPYQHKDFAALRAVENRKPLIRTANGGISCIIDEFGRTISQTNMYERISHEYKMKLNNQLTFYSKNRFLIPGLCVTITVWIVGVILIKKLSNFLFKNNDAKPEDN